MSMKPVYQSHLYVQREIALFETTKKFTGAQNLLEANCDVTVRFCDWCYQVCSGEVKAVLTYFTDEFT